MFRILVVCTVFLVTVFGNVIYRDEYGNLVKYEANKDELNVYERQSSKTFPVKDFKSRDPYRRDPYRRDPYRRDPYRQDPYYRIQRDYRLSEDRGYPFKTYYDEKRVAPRISMKKEVRLGKPVVQDAKKAKVKKDEKAEKKRVAPRISMKKEVRLGKPVVQDAKVKKDEKAEKKTLEPVKDVKTDVKKDETVEKKTLEPVKDAKTDVKKDETVEKKILEPVKDVKTYVKKDEMAEKKTLELVEDVKKDPKPKVLNVVPTNEDDKLEIYEKLFREDGKKDERTPRRYSGEKRPYYSDETRPYYKFQNDGRHYVKIYKKRDSRHKTKDMDKLPTKKEVKKDSFKSKSKYDNLFSDMEEDATPELKKEAPAKKDVLALPVKKDAREERREFSTTLRERNAPLRRDPYYRSYRYPVSDNRYQLPERYLDIPERSTYRDDRYVRERPSRLRRQ